MSVTEAFNLPAQPTTGFVRARMLGGFGYTSPFQQLVVRADQDSDVSGGTNQISFNFDPTYLGLVSQISMAVGTAAADVNVKAQIVASPDAEFFQFSGVIPAHDPGAGSLDSARLWSPPPLLLTEVNATGDGSCSCAIPNVDGESLIFMVWIYYFTKRAAEFVPVDELLDVLSRGTTVT